MCPDVWAANDLTSLGECEAKMVALPFADGDLVYVDGNTCASLTPSLTLDTTDINAEKIKNRRATKNSK